MDFAPTDDQRLAVDGWRRAVERDIAPIAREHQDAAYPKMVAHDLLQRSMAFGVGNGWVPEADGGAGLDFLSSGLLFEELARWSPDLAGVAWVAEGAALKLQQAGSAALKERYLPGMVSGDLIGCSAISEPGVGSDARAVTTRAVRDGKGYRIRGEKMWTSNAAIADLVIVLARTEADGLTLFLLDRQQHGFRTQEIPKLGLNAWPLGQIELPDIWVGEEFILGEPGRGLRETMKGFERSRCFVSTIALGIAQAAMDASITYAGDRVQFGKPIAGHQLVQSMLAQMATKLAAARLLVYRALWLMSNGARCDQEAAMAKLFATEAAEFITSQAIQIHGAFGISKAFPVERHFRNARMLTIPDGTSQINQLIIGRTLTGLSAFA
ncbi:acyl-CoA dehydrogenase family protein [Acidisphaera sp. L21]|uniref:acyl-CoA dehydrogenase family protein n=1 Tax=Acidisphaera sp. L21 TaxID=1641851 RepID=UPI00131DF287|nr:acyl-CoA dehydrogenase family protein [Acidisphaera sp. L21]